MSMASLHWYKPEWPHDLLPHIVDHLAISKSDSTYIEHPRTATNLLDGFQRVTYRDFANAINGIANWFHDTIGCPKEIETVAYIGPNDLRYTAIVLGAVKAGYVVLMLSPRNSIAAQLALCASANCTKIISPDPIPQVVTEILRAGILQHLTLPGLEDLLDVEHPHFVYGKTYQQAKDEPLVVVHTSGSTGIPKKLIMTHEYVARNIQMHSTEAPQGFISQNSLFHGKRVINMMPPFHGAGLVSHLFNGIAFGTVYIDPPPAGISTANTVAEMLRYTTAEAALVTPSLIRELSQDAELLEDVAKQLKLIMFCGGDLPQAIGDIVSSKTLLRCQYGASEIGIVPQILPADHRNADWKYICFPTCFGFEYQPVSDGLSELVVVRNAALEKTQSSFTMFPDDLEYRSRDLFKPHPSIPEYWAWAARADDIIVFLNGEKTNPTSFEQHVVAQNDDVSAALIVGAQKLQAALLVESSKELLTTKAEAAFIECIWPSIEEANEMTPAHARIEKAMILPLDVHHPMLRAGKGTIQRAGTSLKFADKIEQLYQNADLVSEATIDDNTRNKLFESVTSLTAFIRSLLPTLPAEESQDFFSVGMDSLGALGLVRKLRNQLGVRVSISTIYSNPSAPRLAAAMISMRNGEVEAKAAAKSKRNAQIEGILAEFCARLQQLSTPQLKAVQTVKKTVVVTGTTGTVGKFLLASLLNSDAVAHVHCLNRRKDAREVHLSHFASIGAQIDNYKSRVTFHYADCSLPGLGLSTATYDVLRATSNAVIHNAWPVNFNLPLESFRPNLDSMVNLVNLVSGANQAASFFFISSISTIMGRQPPSGRIEEAIDADTDTLLENGYAESKWVAEMLCEQAARSLKVPTSFVRVGQVAGPVEVPGIWNPTEWLPSLVKSSVTLGVLPDSTGCSMDAVHWLPVDLLAASLVDLTLNRIQAAEQGRGLIESAAGAQVFHLQNPKRTTWQKLLPGIIDAAWSLTEREVAIIPCQEWLRTVRQMLDDTMNTGSSDTKNQFSDLEDLVNRMPAVKLLDFYTSSMTEKGKTNELEMANALECSASLREVSAVSDAWMRKWMEQ